MKALSQDAVQWECLPRKPWVQYMCPPNRKVGSYVHVQYTSTIYSCLQGCIRKLEFWDMFFIFVKQNFDQNDHCSF